MKTILKFIFIKVYHSIKKIKRFYYFLHRIYEIIIKKYSKLNNENRFQIIIKIINNIIDL